MLKEKSFEAHFRDQFKKVFSIRFIISVIGQIKQYLQAKVEDF